MANNEQRATSNASYVTLVPTARAEAHADPRRDRAAGAALCAQGAGRPARTHTPGIPPLVSNLPAPLLRLCVRAIPFAHGGGRRRAGHAGFRLRLPRRGQERAAGPGSPALPADAGLRALLPLRQPGAEAGRAEHGLRPPGAGAQPPAARRLRRPGGTGRAGGVGGRRAPAERPADAARHDEVRGVRHRHEPARTAPRRVPPAGVRRRRLGGRRAGPQSRPRAEPVGLADGRGGAGAGARALRVHRARHDVRPGLHGAARLAAERAHRCRRPAARSAVRAEGRRGRPERLARALQ